MKTLNANSVSITEAKKISSNVFEIIKFQQTEKKIKDSKEDLIDWKADNDLEMIEFENAEIIKNQSKLEDLKSKLNTDDFKLMNKYNFYLQDGEGGKDLVDVFTK